MVLAKLFSRAKLRLGSGQTVSLQQLDAWLDVETAAFDTTAAKLAVAFASARAVVDVASYRQHRQDTAETAVIADLPDVRGSHYQADLKRLPPMDRQEEFRMARRHDFLRTLVGVALRRSGLPKAGVPALLAGPVAAMRSALEALPPRRSAPRAWCLAVLDSFEALRNLYVEGSLYIVLGIANRYRGLGVDTADLIQEGNASLYQAIDGFSWRRDVRFRTYAQFWVQQAVLKVLYNHARTVRVPIWVQKVLGKVRRAQEAGRREGVELSHAEIAARIGVPVEKVEWVLNTRRYAVSLDAEVAGGDGATLVQMLPDESLEPIPESIPPGDLRAVMSEAMADLPDRERRILEARFGLQGHVPQTLGAIAKEYGITAERVRQLQNAALGRLKQPSTLRRLQAFVE